ncbi:MAG: hypothetical protein ACOY45_09330 [Pseudomonadota bacterium]
MADKADLWDKTGKIEGVILPPGPSMIESVDDDGHSRMQILTFRLRPWRSEQGAIRYNALTVRMATEEPYSLWSDRLPARGVASIWITRGTTVDPDGAVMTAYLGLKVDKALTAAAEKWERELAIADARLGDLAYVSARDRFEGRTRWTGGEVALYLVGASSTALVPIAHRLFADADAWQARIENELAASARVESISVVALDLIMVEGRTDGRPFSAEIDLESDALVAADVI